MRGVAVLLLLALGGCAGGEYIRPPATAAEWAETNARIPAVNRVMKRLWDGDKGIMPAALCQRIREACGPITKIGPGDNGMGAWSDGKMIYLNLPLLRFLRNDDEIALTIGHEWAHNLVHWPRGVRVEGRKVELEADCVGTLLAIGAGYDGKRASRSYERLAGSVSAELVAMLGDHDYPLWKTRYATVLRATAAAEYYWPITRDLILETCGVAP